MRSPARDGTKSLPPSGFTIIELVVVMMIAAVLMTYGAMALNRASADRSATGARDTFVWLARRARALSVQRGTNVSLSVKQSTNRAKVLLGTTVVDQVYFDKQWQTGLTLSTGSDSVVICYTPRGITQTTSPCTDIITTPVTVTFTRGPRKASAIVQGLGQVEAK